MAEGSEATVNLFEEIAKGLYERYLLYGDSATKIYFDKMKDGKWETNKCLSCDRIFFPPRKSCPTCLSTELEWLPLPKSGTLQAFTWQERALFFGKPDCIGMVELENGIRLVAPILSPYEKLKIGAAVEQDFSSIMDILNCPVFKVKG